MSAPKIVENISLKRKSRRDSGANEAISRNSEIPRFRAAIPFAPMLASTVVEQSTRPKKKNSVDATLYPTTMPTLLLPRCCARLSRIAIAVRRRVLGRGIQRDASISSADRHVLARLPGATLAGRNDAERDCHPWGRRSGLSGSPSGIPLRWIPPYRLFSQLTRHAGGSTGVPDSLDIKQVNTSGPARVSRNPVIAARVLNAAIRSPYPPVISFFYFLVAINFGGVPISRWRAFLNRRK